MGQPLRLPALRQVRHGAVGDAAAPRLVRRRHRLIRSMHHEAFDHAPGELMFCTGKERPAGRAWASWLSYGLGSESKDLPGYVVLVNGRSPKARELIWGSGFLPATHQGVLFRNKGSPILNLAARRARSPPRCSTACRSRPSRRLDQLQPRANARPAVDARIAAYELAFRMQSAAPGADRPVAARREPTLRAATATERLRAAACCWRAGSSSAACASSR